MIWILTMLFFTGLGMVLGEAWLKHRLYPHKFSCPHCKEAGTPFKIAGNHYDSLRRVMLDHLDTRHPG